MAEWLIIAWIYVVGGIAIWAFDQTKIKTDIGYLVLICFWPFAITALVGSYFLISAWKRKWQ